MHSSSRLSIAMRSGLCAMLASLVALTACTSAQQPLTDSSAHSQAASPTTVEPQATPDAAAQAQAQAQAFARWVEGFRTSAREAGVNEATLHSAMDNVRFLPRVIELDRSQPEFTRAVWTYLDTAVSAQRVARGQAHMQALRSVPNPALRLDAIAARYSVAPELLVAVWGIESNYGTHMGDMPAIDALATLAFEGRREAWARSELILALKILQNGDIARDHMLGSWAGAMGQTQFIPSVFTAYAVDADGDGHRDIWGSLPDVMASTANFFTHAGWQAGQPWGLEVRLPSGFDYARADTAIRQSTAQWAQEGVQPMHGTALPALPDASLLLPAGARGPAFLVGQNFRTVLRYNNSISYALAVSLLSQRLAGGPAVQAPWPRDVQPLSRAQVLALQTALNARGFDCGTPDGMVGPATQRGVRQYQRSMGLPADGFPTLELLQGLQPSPP